MTTVPNIKGFNQVEALFNDVIFSHEFNKANPIELKNYKLLKARFENPDFENELAEFICGESSNSFPYRSSHFITKFFKDLGLDFTHDGSTRRFWVKDVLLELPIDKIAYIIEKGLFNKRDFIKEAKSNNSDYDENYRKAIAEFKEFINLSLEDVSTIDLTQLLDLNINIELLYDNKKLTEDQELNQLINEAKERFFNPKDRHIALEKIWDAFERIKTYHEGNKKQSAEKLVKLIANNFDEVTLSREFQELTRIGNDFKIRHHEVGKIEIKDKHLNYLFFRMLSIIDLCLTAINEEQI